jgi:hypothetical protein
MIVIAVHRLCREYLRPVALCFLNYPCHPQWLSQTEVLRCSSRLLRLEHSDLFTWLTPRSPVLDAGSQTWWRWLNIALFLAVWSLELLLDADDDADSVTRWKVD